MPWCMSNARIDRLIDDKVEAMKASIAEVQALAAEVKRSREHIQQNALIEQALEAL